MLTNILDVVIPGGPVGAEEENPVWPFCTCPIFAIFNLMF